MDAKTRAKIERATQKIARLEERIGYLMTQRADAEDALADLLRSSGACKCGDVTQSKGSWHDAECPLYAD